MLTTTPPSRPQLENNFKERWEMLLNESARYQHVAKSPHYRFSQADIERCRPLNISSAGASSNDRLKMSHQ